MLFTFEYLSEFQQKFINQILTSREDLFLRFIFTEFLKMIFSQYAVIDESKRWLQL